MNVLVGVSVAGGTGVSFGRVSVGRTLGVTGTAVCVMVGFGRSAYAHRFSCVAVGDANKTLIDALAGDVPIKKMTSPPLMHNSISHRPAKIRMRLLGKSVLMVSCS